MGFKYGDWNFSIKNPNFQEPGKGANYKKRGGAHLFFSPPGHFFFGGEGWGGLYKFSRWEEKNF